MDCLSSVDITSAIVGCSCLVGEGNLSSVGPTSDALFSVSALSSECTSTASIVEVLSGDETSTS